MYPPFVWAVTQLLWIQRSGIVFRVRLPVEKLPGLRKTVNPRLGPSRLCCSLLARKLCVFFHPGNVGMAASGAQKCPKSEKLDEAQALAKSCAGRPDFLPCDGLSICATHSHGKCFKLHWCCHLGWCHCKFVFLNISTNLSHCHHAGTVHYCLM